MRNLTVMSSDIQALMNGSVRGFLTRVRAHFHTTASLLLLLLLFVVVVGLLLFVIVVIYCLFLFKK